MTQKSYEQFRWITFWAAIALPLIGWLQYYGNPLNGMTAYQLFPLFGLWAFFVMAGHFFVAAVRARQPSLKRNELYSKSTSYFVLSMILLHPGVFVFKLIQDGYGLPPESYKLFLGEALYPFVSLGTFALILFLSYEVLERLFNRPIVQRLWFWVLLSQVVAMIAIFFHALKLGDVVELAWFNVLFVATFGALIVSWWFVLKQQWISSGKKPRQGDPEP